MCAGCLLAWCTLLVLIALASLQPPPPRPVTDPPQWFSADRALIYVSALASQPHPIGTPAHTMARDYVVAELRRLGFAPHVQTVPVVCSRVSRPYRAATVSNVWIRLRGQTSTGTLLIASHYDSVPTGPGASDDGASAAAMLETLRALQTKRGLTISRHNDLVFLWTDAEEAGLMGARAFVSQSSEAYGSANELPLKAPVIALNFEARGVSGPSLMFETSPHNGWLVRQFLRAVPNPTASSLFYAVYKILPNDTDFTEFRDSGMQGLNFAYIDKVSHYHTALDSVEHLDRRSLQHQGDNMLALTRYFGDTPLFASLSSPYPPTPMASRNPAVSSISAPDVIYFNYAHSAVLCYPEAWAMPLALLATLLTACFLIVGLRSGCFTLVSLCVGLLAIPVAIAGVCGGTALLARLFVALAPAPPSVLYLGNDILAGVMLAALALAWGFFNWISRHRVTERNVIEPEGVTAGATLCWLLLTWLTTMKLPGGSYLFVWPLLFVLVVNLMIFSFFYLLRRYVPAVVKARKELKQPELSPLKQETNFPIAVGSFGLLLSVVPIILLIVPAQCLLFSTLSVASLPIITALIVLIVALAFPHFTLLTRLVPTSLDKGKHPSPLLHSLALPLALLLSGLLLVCHGVRIMRPTPDHPQSDSIFYGLNADTGQALWASGDYKADAWTVQFLGDNPSRSGLPDFLPGRVGTFLQAPAPAAPLPPPDVTLLKSHTEKGICTVWLHVTSSRHAPILEICAPDTDVVDAIVEKQLVPGTNGLDHMWSLLYLNVPDKGLMLSLRIKLKEIHKTINLKQREADRSQSEQDTTEPGKAALLLRVIDRSYGLPFLPGKNYDPRPSTFITAPNSGWYQDSVLVSKSFLLSIRH